MPRRFFFWCEHCPTRITVETEVPPSAPIGEPEYTFATSEWVGLAEVGDNGGLEAADRCPACRAQLHDWDDIAARELIPKDGTVSEQHAAWRENVRTGKDVRYRQSAMTDEMEPRGWRLTTQGYVKGPWRIYHAETWCCAFREFFVRNKFESALAAADWIETP